MICSNISRGRFSTSPGAKNQRKYIFTTKFKFSFLSFEQYKRKSKKNANFFFELLKKEKNLNWLKRFIKKRRFEGWLSCRGGLDWSEIEYTWRFSSRNSNFFFRYIFSYATALIMNGELVKRHRAEQRVVIQEIHYYCVFSSLPMEYDTILPQSIFVRVTGNCRRRALNVVSDIVW